MREANIALFEDSTRLRSLIKRYLSRSQHRVVAELSDLSMAIEYTRVLAPGDIDAAIVDGNLSFAEIGDADGNAIIKELRVIGGITIIGFSSGGELLDADVNIRKGDEYAFYDMIQAIEHISERQP